MASDFKVAFDTVKSEMPHCESRIPAIVVVPLVMPLAHPAEPTEPLIVAVDGVVETHVTEEVTSCFVPSASVATASNGIADPCATVAGPGVTAIDVRFCTASTAVWEVEPSCTFTVADPAATPVTTPVLSTV